MKKPVLILLLFFLLAFITKINAQINLVPNGDFEIDSIIPTTGSQLNRAVGWNNTNGYYWMTTGTHGSPDYYYIGGFMGLGEDYFAFPWKSIGKYTFASAITGILLFLLPFSTSILMTLLWTAIGGLVYLAVLMLIDKESRSLPKEILGELRGKKTLAS